MVCLLDGTADGIQQRGAATWNVGGGSELGYVLDGEGGHRHFVGVIKLNERKACIARDIELGSDEVIESGDGRLLHRLHGTGAVKNIRNFGEVWVHCTATLAHGVGHLWGDIRTFCIIFVKMSKVSASKKPRVKGIRSVPSLRSGTSRPALWRVMEIHKIVRAGQYPNCATLAREIEVTPKTIQRDVSFMRDQLGLPLEYDMVRHGYHYTQAVNEFPMLHLSRNDLVALFLARHALDPLRGTGLERMLAESFSKIAEACPGEVSIQWNELDDAFSVKASGVLSADVTLFGDLLDAVTACREVSIDYHKLNGSHPERRTVQPYHVGQIEHGWYLLAHDPQRQGMRTFALQRITNLLVLKSKFERDRSFNARDFLGGGFGVWSYEGKNKPSHEVSIRFEGYAARVVAERMWHSSQKIIPLNKDGSVIEFQAQLSGLEEITRWVLSWGSKARVIGPPELQKMVKGELEKMMRVVRG